MKFRDVSIVTNDAVEVKRPSSCDLDVGSTQPQRWIHSMTSVLVAVVPRLYYKHKHETLQECNIQVVGLGQWMNVNERKNNQISEWVSE